MRVLFVSVGALGHVHPMVPLARALAERGHALRWATSADAGRRIEAVGIERVDVGPPFEEVRGEYLRRYPEARTLEPRDRPDHAFPRLFGEVAADLMASGTIAAARDWQPILVVSDQAAFAGPIAAAAVGAATATHSYGGLTPRHRVEAAAERVTPLWRAAGLEPQPFGGMYDGLYLELFPPSLQSTAADHVARRQLLRPVAFDEVASDDAAIWPAGADERPLVYVTFGTVHRDIEPLRVATAAIASLDVRVLVTVGPAGDPEQLGPQPPNVIIRRYVPQTRVFETASVVASHAGSGTFLGAIGRGLPQLCLPQAADQFVNAEACRSAGVGITLLPEEASEPAIVDAMRRLLATDEFRERARQVGDEIRSMPDPAAVAAVLERLA